MNHQFSPTQFSPAALSAGMESVGVRIDGVDLSYGSHRVLKDIHLDIKPGEFFAFLGPSGCGKTTLLRLIAGFNTAQRGAVTIGGRDISGLPAHKRDVGMVFQSYALWPHMTVRRNVAFGLEERRVPRAEIERRVGAAPDPGRRRQLAGRRPGRRCGGQRTRWGPPPPTWCGPHGGPPGETRSRPGARRAGGT
ncbi:ATP-binding cassette domain-containing protein, partial [Azospirillum brasilense]|nr:ATP-binding cassette domain-containing protein [Azospirillum brasilense]